MSFDVQIVTLAPQIWPVILSEESGLVGKAFAVGTARLTVHDLREFGVGAHRKVDDTPFGGGAGMVLQVGPLHEATKACRQNAAGPVVLLSARGRPFSHHDASRLAAGPGFTLVCGRYEGVDERVSRYIDDEITVADAVLSAGDPAAWVVVDAVTRLLPGVLGNCESLSEESFAGDGGLEYPQYSRPRSYDGADVPSVLCSGDHAAIRSWRRQQAISHTKSTRPDICSVDDL